MGEAVVRALELSAQASADASVSTLSTDVDTMVSDMEALRQAMEETHGALPAAGGSSALGLDGDDTTGGMRQGPAT